MVVLKAAIPAPLLVQTITAVGLDSSVLQVSVICVFSETEPVGVEARVSDVAETIQIDNKII